jgi:hypothetical protein
MNRICLGFLRQSQGDAEFSRQSLHFGPDFKAFESLKSCDTTLCGLSVAARCLLPNQC